MKKYSLIAVVFTLAFLFLIGCPAQSGSGSGGSGSSGGLVSATEGTGTVSGTVDGDATVTLTQSDGTKQTDTTATDDPNTEEDESEYVFEDVPEGDATVTVDTGDGNPTSQDIEVVEGETTEVNPFGSTQEMDNSLVANVYEVSNEGWSTTIENINTDEPLGIEFYSKEINVPERSFSEGFPGITDRFEYFGIIYEGKITAPVSGQYTFKLTCDDGAILYLNNEIIVDGDGVHSTESYVGSVDLVEGQEYDFLLKYFQGPRYEITCVLEVQTPDVNMELFDMDNF